MKMGSTSRIAKAAIAQLCATNNKQSNLINIAKCAGLAKRSGAQILFLPECLGFMGDNAQHTLDNADPSIDDLMDIQQQNGDCFSSTSYDDSFRKAIADTISPSVANTDSQVDINKEPSATIKSIISELCFIANESKLWISGGGIHTLVPSQSNIDAERKIYNTHIIINNKGQIKSYYHKIHLFDVSIPNKVNLQESKTTSPGNKLVVCDSPIGKLGLSICYDVRFPEMYVKLVQEMGAEVLLMPSAFTVPTGKAHWHALLKARAIESQCYVLAAAQVGKHNEKRQSYGHSVAYDPWGELLADAGGYDGEGLPDTIINTHSLSESNEQSPVHVPSIIIANIDLDKLESMRERMPIQQHRDKSSF